MRDVILEAKADDGRLMLDLRSPSPTRAAPSSMIARAPSARDVVGHPCSSRRGL